MSTRRMDRQREAGKLARNTIDANRARLLYLKECVKESTSSTVFLYFPALSKINWDGPYGGADLGPEAAGPECSINGHLGFQG